MNRGFTELFVEPEFVRRVWDGADVGVCGCCTVVPSSSVTCRVLSKIVYVIYDEAITFQTLE